MDETSVLVAARNETEARQKLLPYFDFGPGLNVREDEMLEYLVHIPSVRAADFRTQAQEILAETKAEQADLQSIMLGIVTRALRHLENEPGDFYFQQGLFPGIQLQLYNLPKSGQARANYAPAGFVDWQAIQVDIARDAGRAWDNWEAALRMAGVGVQEFMNFMRVWKSQPQPLHNEEFGEFEDHYNQIWTTIIDRYLR